VSRKNWCPPLYWFIGAVTAIVLFVSALNVSFFDIRWWHSSTELRCAVLRFLIFGGVGQIGAKLSSVFDRTVLTLQSFFMFYPKQGSNEVRDPQQRKKHATITACQGGIRPRLLHTASDSHAGTNLVKGRIIARLGKVGSSSGKIDSDCCSRE
jgi:hypothetical protein